VIGVLIALSAEQGAEAFHWRHQAAEARTLLASELARDAANAINRLKMERCAEQRLDQLGEILDASARSRALPPVGDIGYPPLRQWPGGVWQSVVASQIATHFSREELAGLSYIYGLVRRADDSSEPEQLAWTELNMMVGPGRRLEPASEVKLRSALGRARFYNRTVALTGMRINQAIKEDRVGFSQDDLAAITEARFGSPDHPPHDGYLTPYMLCKPIGAVPPGYGQSTLGASLPLMDDAVRNPPDFGKGR
jgi:hypothetical protein